MASDPITSWQIEGENVGVVIDFLFLGSKITADGDCSYKIRKYLLLYRKDMTNLESVLKSRNITLPTKVHLESVLKSRNITLPTKVHIVKAMVFPVVMYSCESWTVKKAECQRTDAFKLWCQRRLLRVPWTARRSNQSIFRDINPKYWLKGLLLKLKLQYFGHLMRIADSLEKPLMLEKIEGRRRRGGQRMKWLDAITNAMDMSLGQTWGDGEGQGALACCSPWSHKESNWMTEQQQIETQTNIQPLT